MALLNRFASFLGSLPASRTQTARYSSRLADLSRPLPRTLFRNQPRQNVRFLSLEFTEDTPRYVSTFGDETECLDFYMPGGYHPVAIGDVFKGRYRVVDRLGQGTYSTDWIVRDTVANRYVALKIRMQVTPDPPQETQILRALINPPNGTSVLRPGQECVPRVLDEFEINGPNGTHYCSVMEAAQNSLTQGRNIFMFRLDVARAFAAGLIQTVAYIHEQGYVHSNLDLENVLMKMPTSLDKLSIEEFVERFGPPETEDVCRRKDEHLPLPPGAPKKAVIPLYWGSPDTTLLEHAQIVVCHFTGSFPPRKGEVKLGKDLHCRFKIMPPEAYLEPNTPLSPAVDIWMLAVTLWDIVGVRELFSIWSCDEDEILVSAIDLNGPLQAKWHESWAEKYAEHFDETGQRRNPAERLNASWDDAYDNSIRNFRNKTKLGKLKDDEGAAFLSLIRSMMKFLPEERPTAKQVLESEWVVKWALPDLERSLRGE